jgi:hypothetical protein
MLPFTRDVCIYADTRRSATWGRGKQAVAARSQCQERRHRPSSACCAADSLDAPKCLHPRDPPEATELLTSNSEADVEPEPKSVFCNDSGRHQRVIRYVKRYISQMNADPSAQATTHKLRDRFRFIDDLPLAGEQGVLEPVLVAVEDCTTGLECALKLWRKTGTPVDDDLRQLWSHEFRQVDRLMAYAGAQEVIVDVLGLVEDNEFFGVILERSGVPLSDLIRRVPRGHWIKSLGTVRARVLLWRNVRRLVVALGLVHGHGLLHGRLNAAAVATEGADTPDFRLGAFEWSLWVRAEKLDQFHARLESHPQRMVYSFAADWRALGLLVLELLGVTLNSTGEFEPIHATADVDLGLAERRLLKRLIVPARLDLLDADSICHAVDDLIVGIGREMSSRAGAFILAFLRGAPLADAVYEASSGEIARDDYQRQLQWVRADLANGTTLLIPPDFELLSGSMQLVATSMVYS